MSDYTALFSACLPLLRYVFGKESSTARTAPIAYCLKAAMNRLYLFGEGGVIHYSESLSVSDTLQSLPVSVAATMSFVQMQTKDVNDC